MYYLYYAHNAKKAMAGFLATQFLNGAWLLALIFVIVAFSQL